MRFLRRQTHNRRAVYDNNLYVDTTNAIVMGSQNNLLLPSGPTSTRPVSPVNGMIRYNTDLSDVEVYQNTWRSLRYRESGAITQQTLGYGDASTLYFGPLNPAPPAVSQNGYTWTGNNLIVLVENVMQLFNTNYTVVQNPSIAGVAYSASTSGGTAVGATTVNIDTSTVIIYPSVNIIGATVTGSSSLQSATLVSNYTVNANGQLATIQISKATQTAIIPSATTLTITTTTATASGYYLYFATPVPYGKPAVVLSGFDS